MRRFFIATFLILCIPTKAFSSVGFFLLLPNPAGDDALGEYIELRNIGCESVDISDFSLSDASGKIYMIPSGTTIDSHENRSFHYSETKIALNNSGNESVYLKDAGGNILDEAHYSGTQKDNVAILLSLSDEECIADEEIYAGTGTSEEATETNTGEIVDTGSTIDEPLLPSETDSGTTETGSIISESGSIFDVPSTLSGELAETGGLLSETGAEYVDIGLPSETEEGSGSGARDPTNITDTGTTSTEGVVPYTETGLLSPMEMYYSDSDSNGKIDTLEICYPYNLTGSVNTGAIQISSSTGGLSSTRINAQTGYIISGTLSGNILVLGLLEGDIEKTVLKINNTTSSELRLKSNGDIGFLSIGGQIPEDFLLTKSFDEYRKVFAKKTIEKVEEAGTGTYQDHPDLLSQDRAKTELMETGTVNFPEIVPTFQNYTNTTNSGDILTCTTMPCRVNFTLEPIFTGGFLEKDFICSITFGTGIYNTCNPPQFYLIASGSIEITLTHKLSGMSTRNVLFIAVNSSSPNIGATIGSIFVPISNRPPVASIDMDGEWKKFFTSPEVNLIRCYTFTCSVNFTGENSYDPDGDKIRYFWLYDYQDTSTKKDPGVRTFSIGNHTVTLRVTDPYGGFGELKYIIEVVHPDLMPKEEKEKVDKNNKIEKGKTTKKKNTKKKKKLKSMIFFDAPEFLIQNKNPENIRIAGDKYTCYTKTKTCSINLVLTGAQKGYTYEWVFPNQSGSYVSRNPRSFAFSVGDSKINLIVRDLAGNILTTRDIDVEVIKTTKTRGTSKSVAKKTKPEPVKSTIGLATDIVRELDVNATNPRDDSLLFLFFLSGSGLAGYVRIKRKRVKNRQ